MTLLHTDSSLDGLIDTDAEHRLRSKGKNEVAHDNPPHALVQLLHAFRNPFVVVLLVLAGISYCTDIYLASADDRDWTGVTILLAMVTLSSLLRFVQEYRSNKAAARLKAMVYSTATVVRRASETAKPIRKMVPVSSLVVGDIVDLHAGDMIPADIRLIKSRDLFVSQAALTGEALPVEKYDTLGAVMQKSANCSSEDLGNPLERPNICFMGTNVVSGTATAVVVETGANTYFGALAKSVTTRKRIETSFDRGVNSVSWLLIRFMLVMVPIVF
ncbi:magnesium-translocating P-type ATPase [Caballeronia pedi]|uniref:Magnesium-translocating P-type ATPase n=1 Tax=Caballeronia pedi TaxID=1777141 RepID=A0A158BH11_9BURK|nr:magnesium-translocating P-type ATPase [Caballeronia pedi]